MVSAFSGWVKMRWNSCGKMKTATEETVLYLGMDEGKNHERGVGLLRGGLIREVKRSSRRD